MSQNAPSKRKEPSKPTGRWVPCPYAASVHPHLATASQVQRGPKRFHATCSVCGTRSIIAPKLLDARDPRASIGFTSDEARAQGWTLL